MKYILKISTFFCFIEMLYPQGYFPLQQGNLWQYDGQMIHQPWSTQVNGDTLLQNSKVYKIYDRSLPSKYIRQDGSKVFGYNLNDSSEFTLFDFAAIKGDTINNRFYFSHHFVTILQDTSRHPSSNQRIWKFVDYMVVTPEMSYDFATWTVLDSIGIIQIEEEPGYVWVLTGARIDGVVRWGIINTVPSEGKVMPLDYVLYQNFPNPFNPVTTIKFYLSKQAELALEIFNTVGQKIATLANGKYSQGQYTIQWDAGNLPSGIYFYQLRTNYYLQTKKLLLLK